MRNGNGQHDVAGSCALLTSCLPNPPDQDHLENEKPLKLVLFQRLGLVAGKRSHHDLRRIDELAAQVKVVAGDRNHHDLLFRAAA